MTEHPIHVAGGYFACHTPEQDWINDQKAQALASDAARNEGDDESPNKETEKSACSQSPSHS